MRRSRRITPQHSPQNTSHPKAPTTIAHTIAHTIAQSFSISSGYRSKTNIKSPSQPWQAEEMAPSRMNNQQSSNRYGEAVKILASCYVVDASNLKGLHYSTTFAGGTYPPHPHPSASQPRSPTSGTDKDMANSRVGAQWYP